jgi:hypothetical protein
MHLCQGSLRNTHQRNAMGPSNDEANSIPPDVLSYTGPLSSAAASENTERITYSCNVDLALFGCRQYPIRRRR